MNWAGGYSLRGEVFLSGVWDFGKVGFVSC